MKKATNVGGAEEGDCLILLENGKTALIEAF
jgi:hypothetical protein